MFTSFVHSVVPMRAWFFDKEKSSFVSKAVFGWALADSGQPEAIILVPNGGVGLRASQFNDFVAVLPSDAQPTDAVDEVAAGLVRVIGKEGAEAWRTHVTGGAAAAPKLAVVPTPFDDSVKADA
jgi:hypothetical protein